MHQFGFHIIDQCLETRNAINALSVYKNNRASTNAALQARIEIRIHSGGILVVPDHLCELGFIQAKAAGTRDEILFAQ